MLVAWTSDAAYSLLHAARWSVGDTAYRDPDSGRLVWLVYCHRGEQQIIAKAESQTGAWNEAVRLAGLVED
jgi:hypothetical protein